MKNRKIVGIIVLFGILYVMLISILFAVTFKDVVYKGKTLGDVVFKHSKHVTDKKMVCKDCHPDMFKMKQGTSGMTMATINEGKHCGKCHNGVKAFDVKKNCGMCHKAKK